MSNPFLKPRVKKESAIEKYLIQQVVKYGGLIRKVTFPGHTGAPDRVVMFPGVLVWVELKSKTGVLSPIQYREHIRFREMGQWVEVPRTEHEVDRLVEMLYIQSRSAA